MTMKSRWTTRLVARELLKRFKLVASFLLFEVLIVGLLLHLGGRVPRVDLWLAYSICHAVYLISFALFIRCILVRIARDRISRHLFAATASDLSFAKDMLVLICVLDDHDQRLGVRFRYGHVLVRIGSDKVCLIGMQFDRNG